MSWENAYKGVNLYLGAIKKRGFANSFEIIEKLNAPESHNAAPSLITALQSIKTLFILGIIEKTEF